jgi:hypothetical protein
MGAVKSLGPLFSAVGKHLLKNAAAIAVYTLFEIITASNNGEFSLLDLACIV